MLARLPLTCCGFKTCLSRLRTLVQFLAGDLVPFTVEPEGRLALPITVNHRSLSEIVGCLRALRLPFEDNVFVRS